MFASYYSRVQLLLYPVEHNSQQFFIKRVELGGVADLLQKCPLGIIAAKFVTHSGDLTEVAFPG